MNEADKKRKDQEKIIPLKTTFKELIDYKSKITSKENNNTFPESTHEPRTIDGHIVFVERKK